MHYVLNWKSNLAPTALLKSIIYTLRALQFSRLRLLTETLQELPLGSGMNIIIMSHRDMQKHTYRQITRHTEKQTERK